MSVSSTALAQVRRFGTALYHPGLTMLYLKYRNATMLPALHFVENMQLIRSVPLGIDDWIVECGTWKGGVAAAMIEATGGQAQYAFLDSFQGLPPAGGLDGASAHAWQQDVKGKWFFDNCTATREEFDRTLARIPHKDLRVEVFEGWFRDTLPRVSERSIAFLRLDVDWFESTLECLDALFPFVKPGGVVVVDDYGTWDGCNLAVHRFLSESERPEAIRTTPRSRVAYIVKV